MTVLTKWIHAKAREGRWDGGNFLTVREERGGTVW